VGNNPVTYTDPSGLFVHKKIKKAVGKVVYAACSQPQTVLPCGYAGLGPLGDSYFDLNITAGCGLGGSLGLQYSAGEGFHPYYGGGITTCAAAASFTVAPDQSITSGANCGVQGSFLAPTPWVVGIGPTGQFGAAPLEDKEGNIDFFSADAEPFGEIGVSVGLPYGVGVSATCIRVLDVPFLSW
jgi:hypothetical protein